MTPAQKAAADILMVERRAQALNMRKNGTSYEAIGTALNISHQAAREMVQRALATMVREPTEETIKLERERLDAALEGVMRRVNSSDEAIADRATDVMIRLMARRARLDGLDAPTKVIVKEEPASKLTDEQLAQAATEAAKVLAKGDGT